MSISSGWPLVGALLVGAVALPPPLLAAPACDAKLRPLKGSAHDYRQRSTRCEGMYDSLVSGLSLDVVSFTRGPLQFSLTPQTVLSVDGSTQQPPLNVRAVAIPIKTYYRMDATLSPGSPFEWPARDVLAPQDLTADRIGVYGWTAGAGGKTYVPVRVTAAGSPAAGSSTPQLVVRPSFHAAKVKWRSAAAGTEPCGVVVGTWRDAISAPVPAGWPVKIALAEVPPGFSCLEVAAKPRDSEEWTRLTVRIEVPRP